MNTKRKVRNNFYQVITSTGKSPVFQCYSTAEYWMKLRGGNEIICVKAK